MQVTKNFSNRLSRLLIVTTVLAWLVIMLGAYTRLTDAGLGCPDWPGCYGKLVVPTDSAQAQQIYPHQPLVKTKAWTEMVHRYAVGVLSLLIISIFTIHIKNQHPKLLLFASCLVLMLVFQALLGKWTVTWRLLPAVVMAHLIGGLTILGLLWSSTLIYHQWLTPKIIVPGYLIWLANLTIIILALQIALGGWTSANYAGIVCLDFPTCNGYWWPPQTNFYQAFGLANLTNWQPLNYPAKVAIHLAHRLGALITSLSIIMLSIVLYINHSTNKVTKLIITIILALLGLQITLGILNILWVLPLPIALLHNGNAACLLLALISLRFSLTRRISAVGNEVANRHSGYRLQSQIS